MRRAIAACAAAGAVALCASGLGSPAFGASHGTTGHTGSTGPTGPTAKQISAAVRKAKQSVGLWATVNICDTKKNPDTIGIRAQMPALGFLSSLQMVVKLEYYSTATASFKPLPTATDTLTLGQDSTGFHQDGVTFTVKPPATLQATVEFIWRSGTSTTSTVYGQTTVATTSAHTGVQQADPAGYSAAVCRIT